MPPHLGRFASSDLGSGLTFPTEIRNNEFSGKCETSYLEDAEIKQDGNPDESAGPAEADETLG